MFSETLVRSSQSASVFSMIEVSSETPSTTTGSAVTEGTGV